MNPIVDAVIGVIDGPLDKLLGRFFPNKDDAQKAKLAMQQMLVEQEGQLQQKVMDLQLAQIEVNKEEAKSASLFVAGWRPAAGWTCVGALAWQFVLQPMASWCLTVASVYGHFTVPPLPTLDTNGLFTLLGGLLGLGGLRTMEKIKGEVDRSNLREP